MDRSPKFIFLFVSAVPATLFNDICFSARNSNSNPEDFYQHQINCSEDRRKFFRQFCKYLEINVENSEGRCKAYDYLRRIHVELYPDTRNSYNDLKFLSESLLTGEAETVISTLLGYAGSHDRYGNPIYADDLLKYLESQGIHSKNLVQDTRVRPAIKRLHLRFKDSIYPNLIDKTLIHRKETEQCLDAINNKGIIILHGAAGSGKSVVLYELVQKLNDEYIPCLPVRLDRHLPANTAANFGKSMDLPASPTYCLIAVSGMRQSVLILDQLDAIRWTSTHSPIALDLCKELVSQVISYRRDGKKISVVLACRTFDLEHDPEIRNWLNNRNDEEGIKLEVRPLKDTTLREIVGESFDLMNRRQKEILSNPQNLSMWCELFKLDNVPAFRSSTELMNKFWISRRSQLEKRDVTADDMNSILNKLVNWLEKKGRISAPSKIISNCSPKSISELKSHGIIQEQNSRISFCHQSCLDFLIAERLLSEIDKGGSILDWLGSKEQQTLFHREQLRQALVLLSDDSPENFLEAVKKILQSGEVRFHLKHLVLELIWQIESIPACLADFFIKLLDDVYWEPHIIETVFHRHVSFIEILIERGIISKWLNSGDLDIIDRALILLRSVNNKITDKVTGILQPFMKEGDWWQNRILNTICRQITDDSEFMFDIRIQLVRNGVISDFVDWKSLSARYPIRALRLIEAVISNWGISKESYGTYQRKSRLEQWYENDMHELSKVADRCPEKTWDMFMPQIIRLTSFEVPNEYDRSLMIWHRKRIVKNSHDSIELAQGLVELSILAGIKLAKEKPELLLIRTKPLENNVSSIVQEILIEVYAHLPGKYADVGINWFLSDFRNFRIGEGFEEHEWMPAVRLIKSLSPHCSDDLFVKLEQSIVNYHSPDEKKLAKSFLELRKKGAYHHYWGDTQYFLLPALPVNRISRTTSDLISVLNRKFANYPEQYFLKGHFTGVLSIDSKIDSKSKQISDHEWLKIISNTSIPEECVGGDWVQVSDDKAVQASIWQFSRSLSGVANRYPERFGQLALQFPKDTHHKYISAIFNAMALTKPPSDVPPNETKTWRPASIDTVWAVWDKFREMKTGDIAKSFCSLMEDRADEEWPASAIEKLIYIAINHPDPEPGKLNLTSGGHDFSTDGKSVELLFKNSINCVRGAAALAIANLIWHHPHWLDKLKPGIESLISDHHPAVRIASINILLTIYNINPAQAVTWFCKLSKGDLRVPASKYAVVFFNHTILGFYNQLKPIALEMINAAMEEVSTRGAELSTAYFLFHGLFEEEVELCRKGTAAQRKGVAKTAASFINDARYTETCQKFLFPLLNDPDSEVRKETVFTFGDIFFSSSKGVDFAKHVIQSKAFTDSAFRLIHDLKDFKGSLILCHPIILEICRVITTSLLEASKAYQSRFPYELEQISPLLLRLYEQAIEENPGVANQCLDAWDTLYEHRVGFRRSLTQSIDK